MDMMMHSRTYMIQISRPNIHLHDVPLLGHLASHPGQPPSPDRNW